MQMITNLNLHAIITLTFQVQEIASDVGNSYSLFSITVCS